MRDKTDQQITLAAGRMLGYSEYGDPDGKPVFYFHGAPGSRIEWPLYDDAAWAEQYQARFYAVDRPDIGMSDFQPGRKLGDWSDDILQLANKLGLDRFAVWGYSGGGPYAAVCPLKIPSRLTKVVIVSCVGPFYELPEVYDLIPQGSRT
jgi:pimeloyl-ACP methyl ester carboxylesterase